MMNMVSWRDYAGVDGFGQSSVEELRELQKALTAGSEIGPVDAAPGVGFPLRVESLERTLKNTTYRMEHIRLWRGIPKAPAYNPVEEFNQIRDYGSQALNSFFVEGELPEESDATYSREFARIKFLGVMRRVSHVMTLIKPAHGNVIAQETVAGTMKLLRDVERNLFFARDDLDPLQWRGLEQLIELGATADNIIDLRGQPLSEDILSDAALTIQDAPNFGTPTHVHMNPKVKMDLIKTFFPKARYDLTSKNTDGKIGNDIQGFISPAGDVVFEPNVFITDGDGEPGGLPEGSAGNLNKIPGAPTITAAPSVTGAPVAGSLWTAQDAGAYNWQIVACNAAGQSAPVNVGTLTMAASQAATFGVTPGFGPRPTHYKLYRTGRAGAVGSERLIKRIPNTTGLAQLTVTDLNEDLPGTTKAFMFQQNEDNFTFKQLAPMVKMPLAPVDTSIRWLQLLYGGIQLFTPRHNVVFKNIGRVPGYVGSI